MHKKPEDQGQMPVTDDEELAKVLAGMNQQTAQPAVTADAGLQFEETQAQDGAPAADQTPVQQPATEQPPAADPAGDTAQLPSIELPNIEMPAAEPAPSQPETPQFETVSSEHHQAAASPELESIKKTALEELRPLVDKLDLPADERFDTLLLIIRSTDDQSLVGAAHDAAKAIQDDGKRAQALLDVIKEIDYFANQPK